MTIDEVRLRLLFFGEHVGEIVIAFYVGDITEVGLHVFADGVFAHLNVVEAFGCHIVGPLHTCLVIVFDGDGTIGDEVEEIEVFEDVGNVLEAFDEFIGGVDFCFGGRARSDSLTF